MLHLGKPKGGWLLVHMLHMAKKGPIKIDLALVEWANLLRPRLPVIKPMMCIFKSVNCRKGKLWEGRLPFVL